MMMMLYDDDDVCMHEDGKRCWVSVGSLHRQTKAYLHYFTILLCFLRAGSYSIQPGPRQ